MGDKFTRRVPTHQLPLDDLPDRYVAPMMRVLAWLNHYPLRISPVMGCIFHGWAIDRLCRCGIAQRTYNPDGTQTITMRAPTGGR
jgi:hypothetical protein